MISENHKLFEFPTVSLVGGVSNNRLLVGKVEVAADPKDGVNYNLTFPLVSN